MLISSEITLASYADNPNSLTYLFLFFEGNSGSSFNHISFWAFVISFGPKSGSGNYL